LTLYVYSSCLTEENRSLCMERMLATIYKRPGSLKSALNPKASAEGYLLSGNCAYRKWINLCTSADGSVQI